MVGNKERQAILMYCVSAAGLLQERGGGVGKNRLHQEGSVSDGLAASGRSVSLVLYRNRHWPGGGEPWTLYLVQSSLD